MEVNVLTESWLHEWWINESRKVWIKGQQKSIIRKLFECRKTIQNSSNIKYILNNIQRLSRYHLILNNVFLSGYWMISFYDNGALIGKYF